MDIIIDDSKTLGDVRRQFHEVFPYLKLEFFKKPHHENEGSPASEVLDHNLTIAQARSKHTEGYIQISKFEKVSTLEKQFEENYGLHIQVFRKVHDTWIETIFTDFWTLDEQNKRGENFHVKTA